MIFPGMFPLVWYGKLVQLCSHPRMRKRTTDDAMLAAMRGPIFAGHLWEIIGNLA
jgi:hypothetical protein